MVNHALLVEEAEKALHAAVQQLAPQVADKFAAHDFAGALSQLASTQIGVSSVVNRTKNIEIPSTPTW